MLSRRNIRVKVMQCLYTTNRDETLSSNPSMVTEVYQDSIRNSYELYLFNVLQIREITKHALKDEANRKKKHLPSAFDKIFSTKLYNNPLVQSLVEDEGLKNALDKCEVSEILNEDTTRLLYNDFARTREYKTYLKNPNTTNEDHLDILLLSLIHISEPTRPY